MDAAKYIGVVVTLLTLLVSIVYNFATMRSGISDNKADIAERRLTGKTVRSNTNRIIKLETSTAYYKEIILGQGSDIENLRVRARTLEKAK